MDKLYEKSFTFYEKFCDSMKKDTKGTEIAIYTVSGILFGIAYYRVRPLSKFRKPSDIPKHFLVERQPQNGIVQSIESNINSGPLLRVNHKPPINLLFASKKALPVKISGVEINGNGYSWLQSVTVNHKVRFIPLLQNSDNAECKVYLLNSSPANPSIDLAECLIGLGFGRAIPNTAVQQQPENIFDKQLQSYYKKLTKIEYRARRQRNGMWSLSIPPPPWPINKIQLAITKQINRVLPANRRLPELIR